MKIVHDVRIDRVPRCLFHSTDFPRLKSNGHDERKGAGSVLKNGIPGEGLRQVNDAVLTGYVYDSYFLCRWVENRPGSGDPMSVIPYALLPECDRTIHTKSFL